MAKGRDSPNVKKKQSVSGKIKTVRLPVSEYKKWTPIAFLKVCFTANSGSMSLTRGASRMRRTRGTRPNAAGKRKGNPQARATRAAADFCGASSSYVQQIRDAVASLLVERQKHSLDSVCHCENAVVEILLDETELKISLRKNIDGFWQKGTRHNVIHANTTAPELAVHGSIHFSRSDVAFLQDLVVPMVVMGSNKGSRMLNVLDREVEALVDAMKNKCSKWILVMASDSAKANKKI